MPIRNVNYAKIESLTKEQRKDLGIEDDIKKGIVAIETHNPEYKIKGVVIKRGVVNYILDGN